MNNNTIKIIEAICKGLVCMLLVVNITMAAVHFNSPAILLFYLIFLIILA